MSFQGILIILKLSCQYWWVIKHEIKLNFLTLSVKEMDILVNKEQIKHFCWVTYRVKQYLIINLKLGWVIENDSGISWKSGSLVSQINAKLPCILIFEKFLDVLVKYSKTHGWSWYMLKIYS